MTMIRLERLEDIAVVRELLETTFGQSTEAAIVDSIRKACSDVVAIVAIEDEKIIGHIFFSPVSVLRGDRITKGMGLAPMAVLPAYHMIPSISVTIKADKIFCIQIRYFEKQLFVPL